MSNNSLHKFPETSNGKSFGPNQIIQVLLRCLVKFRWPNRRAKFKKMAEMIKRTESSIHQEDQERILLIKLLVGIRQGPIGVVCLRHQERGKL